MMLLFCSTFLLTFILVYCPQFYCRKCSVLLVQSHCQPQPISIGDLNYFERPNKINIFFEALWFIKWAAGILICLVICLMYAVPPQPSFWYYCSRNYLDTLLAHLY